MRSLWYMLRGRIALAALALLPVVIALGLGTAGAEAVDCGRGTSSDCTPALTISPAVPNEGDPVTVTVSGVVPFCTDVFSSHTILPGNVIDVTFYLVPAEFCIDVFPLPPPGGYTRTHDLGPLSAGGYLLEVTWPCISSDCFAVQTLQVQRHDAAMSKLDTGGKDIHLGTSGTNVRGVKAHCRNKNLFTDNIRCTVQISGLPAGCTAQSSGHDKMFGTADDGIPQVSGGYLLDDTSSYPAAGLPGSDMNFDFKVKTSCSPVPSGAIVMFQGCADHLADDPLCVDNLDPFPANNVRTRFNILKK